jgi:hypothetical protein
MSTNPLADTPAGGECRLLRIESESSAARWRRICIFVAEVDWMATVATKYLAISRINVDVTNVRCSASSSLY